MHSGQFKRKFLWLVRGTVKENTYGDETESWTESAYTSELWGSLEELSAREIAAQGMLGSQVTARIILHNLPGVKMTDRLEDMETGQVYLIDGITQQWNSVTCEVHRWEN